MALPSRRISSPSDLRQLAAAVMSLHTNIARGESGRRDKQSHRDLGGVLSQLAEDDSAQTSVLSIRPAEEHFTSSPTLEDTIDHSGPVSASVCEVDVYKGGASIPEKLIVETRRYRPRNIIDFF